MLISALTSAFNFHLVHKLSKTVHPFVNAHYSQLAFVAINGTLTQLSSAKVEITHVPWSFALILISIALSTMGAQYLIIMANSIKPPSMMMPFGYIGVVMGFIADIYLFGTSFTVYSVVGIFLTSSGLFSGFLVSKG